MDKAKTIVWMVGIMLVFLAIIGMIFLFANWQIGVILLGIPGIYLLAGLRQIYQEDRAVIEVLGAFYKIKGPGLIEVFPIIMGKRVMVDTREQPIRLFPQKPSLDFKGGGTAILVDPIVWVRVKGAKEKNKKEMNDSIQKMTYVITNWWDGVQNNIETTLRSYLNTLTPEEALEEVREKGKPWWEIIKEAYPELEPKFSGWGLEAIRITITDFDWSKEVISARQLVFNAQRQIQKAEHDATAEGFKAKQEAQRIGATISEIVTIFQARGYGKEKARNLAPAVFNFVKAAETKSLFLTSGLEETGGMTSLIAQAAATIAKISEKEPKKAVEKKGREGEEEEK